MNFAKLWWPLKDGSCHEDEAPEIVLISRMRPEDLGAREIRTCQICGARFSATKENESCPVCMLRKALAGGVESSDVFL